jgi:hypothetical protein
VLRKEWEQYFLFCREENRDRFLALQMRYCCGVFRWRTSMQLQFYCEGSIAQLISMERETMAVEWGLAAFS